jgi:MoxR-like ATPase
MHDAAETYRAVREEMESVLVGVPDVIERLTIALFTRGHVLLEGPPGVAKTTAATLLARASDLDSRRIQFTPDVRPADVTGTHVYREATGEFELRRGPVFTNVLIADEVNRGSPQTQSALLEAMEEGHVTIEGETIPVPSPFMVVATRNPIETVGTFDLPVAQRDRFQLRLVIDVPDRDTGRALLDRRDENPRFDVEGPQQVVTADELRAAREAVASVYVDGAVKEYVLDLVEGTREHPRVEHGASPRATFAFLDGAKAAAAIDGREFVTPDDVRTLGRPVLSHRLVLDADAELSDLDASDVVDDVLATVDVPDGETDASVDNRGPDSLLGDGASIDD